MILAFNDRNTEKGGIKLKFKCIYGEVDKIEDQVNSWVKSHSHVEIISTQQSSVVGRRFYITYVTVTIWYREPTPCNPNEPGAPG